VSVEANILFKHGCIFYQKSKAISDVSHYVSASVSLFAGMFLKSKGVCNLTLVVPSVQHFLSRVVVNHAVVLILVNELYVGVPLFTSLGVVSKVDSSGLAVIAVDAVDNSTSDKSVSHVAHPFCEIQRKWKLIVTYVRYIYLANKRLDVGAIKTKQFISRVSVSSKLLNSRVLLL